MSDKLSLLIRCMIAIACIVIIVWFSVAGIIIAANTKTFPAEYETYHPNDKAAIYRKAHIVGMFPIAEEYTALASSRFSGSRVALFCAAVLSDGSACMVKIPASGYVDQLSLFSDSTTDISMESYEPWRMPLEYMSTIQAAVTEETSSLEVKGITAILPSDILSAITRSSGVLDPEFLRDLSTSIMLDLTTEVPETVTEKPSIPQPSVLLFILALLLVYPFTVSSIKTCYEAYVQSDKFIWGNCSHPDIYAPVCKIAPVPAILADRSMKQVIIECTDGFRMVLPNYGKDSAANFAKVHAYAIAEKTGIELPEELMFYKKAAAQDSGDWICSCGRTHASYVSSCVCGVQKKDVLLSGSDSANDNDTQ